MQRVVRKSEAEEMRIVRFNIRVCSFRKYYIKYMCTVLATQKRVAVYKLIRRDRNKNKLSRKVSESHKSFEGTNQNEVKESDW